MASATRFDHVLVDAPSFLFSKRIARLYSVMEERYELVAAQVKDLAPWLAQAVDALGGQMADSFERHRLQQAQDIELSTTRVKYCTGS